MQKKAPSQNDAITKELSEDYNYPVDVIKAALILHPGCRDVEALADWCENNAEDADKIEDILSGDHDLEIVPEMTQEAVEIDEDNDDESSVHKMKAEFVNFMKDVDSINDSNNNNNNAVDFVNFSQLARGLERLLKSKGRRLNRTFPGYLNKGKPNLIVCSEKDVHRVALSIYAHKDVGGEQRQRPPLPALDEVLICTKDTTAEQVELICRRAFSDTSSGKIYTVVHTHLLNIDVGIKLEELFEGSTPDNGDYRIVFICAKEGCEQSYVSR